MLVLLWGVVLLLLLTFVRCFVDAFFFFFLFSFCRLGETTANCDHARKILQKQIQSALHIATDHKSAIEQTLGSATEQVKELQKTVLEMPLIQ